METILNFLGEHYPTILLLVVAVLLTTVIVFRISKFYYTRFIPIEEITKDLPCDIHSANVAEIPKLSCDVSGLSSRLFIVEKYIMKENPDAIDTFLAKNSPYQVSPMGNLLLNISGARKCIDQNTDTFVKAIEKLEPKVALDVEDFSLTVLVNHVDSDIFNELKNYVYNAPCPLDLENKETGEKTQLKSPLTLEVVLKVMSIYLRDKYFEVHPEVDNAQ